MAYTKMLDISCCESPVFGVKVLKFSEMAHMPLLHLPVFISKNLICLSSCAVIATGNVGWFTKQFI